MRSDFDRIEDIPTETKYRSKYMPASHDENCLYIETEVREVNGDVIYVLRDGHKSCESVSMWLNDAKIEWLHRFSLRVQEQEAQRKAKQEST
jgi:hypothetical protein